MNACTIIAKNYLAFARVLARSFNEQHPDGRFTVLVLDEIEGRFDPAQEPFEVVSPADIELPEFEQMAGAYDMLEVSTAVKPSLLRRLLRDRDHVVYLDPDIRLYAPLAGLDELAVEHGIVLTPHNVAAIPRDGKKPSEADILVTGAYDLGFIAVSGSDDCLEFLDWWAERLRTDGSVDTERGDFVAQRWIDLVPGIVPSFELLRDPAYNVAYWNLHGRALSRNGAGYEVDGRPLRFFHFSGYDPRNPHMLSKHQDRVDLVSLPVLRELCDAYAAELLDAGYEKAIEWPYTYTEMANGLPLIPSLRRMYADGLREGELTRSVFEPQGAGEFVDYAKGPADDDLDPRVTRYAMSVYESRRDLREAYPELTGQHLEWFLGWFADYGAQELGPELSVLSGVDPKPPPRARPTDRGVGVNLVGYFSAELGVGEVGRQVAGALDAVDVPVLPIGLVASSSRQGHTFGQRRGLSGPFDFNLLCVNADQTANVARMAGPRFFEDRYTIGWWWWEISTFPTEWLTAFDHLDELWVGSRFVADTLAPLTTKPVILMPTPVELPGGIHADRARFGLDEDAFVFLVVFDHNSVFERKNPVGAIEAFKLAFETPRDDLVLVIKSINADSHPDGHDRLRYAAGSRPDIVLMDDYLSASDKNALVASCDAYVSLHRSEGFGFSLAEAMLLGKPVIASEYSGNADFVRPDTAYPVRCTMTKIGPGNEPYMADASWADPDLEIAAGLMADVFADPTGARARAAAGARWITEYYSAQAAGRAMRARLDQLRKLEPELGVDYTQRTQVVAEQQRKLSHRGPASSRAGRWSPKRAFRSLVVRSNRPVILYVEELHREMANALVEANEIASEMAAAGQARADATTLAQGRRLEGRIAALDGELRADRVDWASQERRLAELTGLIEHARGMLDVATLVDVALTSRAQVADGSLSTRDDESFGRVLALSPGADVFETDEPLMRESLRPYLEVLAGREPVVDLRCRRGELLDLLAQRGTRATGLDTDPEARARSRAKGHDVLDADPVEWLEQAASGSIGALVGLRLAERLDQTTLVALLAAARRALASDGVLVLGNTNPYAAQALKLFWVDPANRHPLFPEAMLALVGAAGFGDAFAFSPGATGDYEVDRLNEEVYAVVARGVA